MQTYDLQSEALHIFIQRAQKTLLLVVDFLPPLHSERKKYSD